MECLDTFYAFSVSCKENMNPGVLGGVKREATDYTVLAEFSSVVADTQQYIVPQDDEQGTIDSEEVSACPVLMVTGGGGTRG